MCIPFLVLSLVLTDAVLEVMGDVPRFDEVCICSIGLLVSNRLGGNASWSRILITSPKFQLLNWIGVQFSSCRCRLVEIDDY